jgi:hypothetical protein
MVGATFYNRRDALKRNDWLCPICSRAMIKISWPYMTCPRAHGKLHRAWSVKDLPLATFIDYRRFSIRGKVGYWEYVPHAHFGCMNHAPEPHTIVARVERRRGGRRWHQAMTFRPAKAPRNKK